MGIDKICRYYSISRSGLKAETKYNLKPDRTLKYFKLGCFNCDGYNESCENYKSLESNKNDYKHEIMEM